MIRCSRVHACAKCFIWTELVQGWTSWESSCQECMCKVLFKTPATMTVQSICVSFESMGFKTFSIAIQSKRASVSFQYPCLSSRAMDLWKTRVQEWNEHGNVRRNRAHCNNGHRQWCLRQGFELLGFTALRVSLTALFFLHEAYLTEVKGQAQHEYTVFFFINWRG